MSIARAAGWEGGARSGDRVHPCARPLALLDIDWKRTTAYAWERHLRTAREERPWLAGVPDLLAEDQLPGALARAEELAPSCEAVLLIPKVEIDLPCSI